MTKIDRPNDGLRPKLYLYAGITSAIAALLSLNALIGSPDGPHPTADGYALVAEEEP